MFKGKNKQIPYVNIETVIGEQVFIKGEFKSDGSVRVDGEVEGQMEVKGDLVIGDKGRLRGDALVANILVAGLVEGNIVSRGRIEITPTGRIKGGVQCKSFVVEEGGMFQGNCRMQTGETNTRSEEKTAKAKPQPSQSPA